MLKPRQLVTVLTLGLMAGSLFYVFSPEVARSQTTTPTPRGLELVGTALMEDSESPLAGVSVHGNLAFVGGSSTGYTDPFPNVGVRIVDLSNPGDPQLVGRIPLRSRSAVEDHSHGDAVATHIASELFQGDVAIVLQGVPDSFSPEAYPQPYGIWDVTDPRNPEFLSIVSFGTVHGKEGGALGDKPMDSKAVAGNYFYTLYDAERGTPRSIHLAVVDISDPRNPLVVGDWQDNSDVGILGLSLNEAGTRAYLTGVSPVSDVSLPAGISARDGYVYILDIQNPSQPTEIGRYIYPLRGVPSSVSKAVPNGDDSLLVFVDHSWQPGAWGIVHILDTSDLTAIHEISTFALPGSDDPLQNEYMPIATDVALQGNLISSTWLRGGLRVIDISDPRRPVQVGEFLSPIDKPLSDVALKDDLIVATAVWSSGLYILRQTAEAPTVVIDEAKSMRVSAGGSEAFPGFHVSWEWPDGTREAAWDGFLNIGGVDYKIPEDGWVYVWTRQREWPYPVEKVDLTVTGVYSWGVTTFVRETEPVYVIFDRVQIFLEVRSPEVPVGATAEILVRASYAYDNAPFEGTVTLSEDLTQVEAGTYSYTVVSIDDSAYGLTAFNTNTVEVTFYVPPPFYTQLSFLAGLLALGAAVGVALFLWRRRSRRPKGTRARVDRPRM